MFKHFKKFKSFEKDGNKYLPVDNKTVANWIFDKIFNQEPFVDLANGHILVPSGTFDYAIQYIDTSPVEPSGKVLVFDGLNDNLTISSALSNDFDFTTNFCIEAWVKTTATGYNFIITKYGIGDKGWDVFVQASDVRSDLYDDTTTTLLSSISIINDGNWHYVVYNLGNTIGEIYLDGALLISAASTWAIPLLSTNGITVGARNGWLYFDGSIAQIRVSNGFRTAAEILEYYKKATG